MFLPWLSLSCRQREVITDHDDFHLRIAKIPAHIPMDRPIKLVVRDIDGTPDTIDLELEKLTTDVDATVHGKEIDQYWEGAFEDFFPTKGDTVYMPHVLGQHSVTISWTPSHAKDFKPIPGAKYRICVMGEAAMMGGGPVSYSNTFTFSRTKRKKHR